MERELRIHNVRLEEVVAERTQELTSFLDLTMLISDNRTLNEVLDGALDRIIDYGKCQAVCIHLITDNQAHLALFAVRGFSQAQQDQLQELPLDPDLSVWFADRSKPDISLDLSTASSPFASLWLEDFQYFLGVQLVTRGQTLGLLSYYREENQAFSLDDISLLTALADQLRIIIENHRLRDQIEEIAVISERQRLAREIHDSVNQSLYSLRLFAISGREAAEDGDTERLASSLERIDEIALDARTEMRLLLHQLQPSVLEENNLTEALQQRFDSVERRLGIEVDYQVEGHLDLPDKTVEGLYWVILEILNNSLQHSRASRITVRLEMVAPTVTMKIIDDGQGFDPELLSGGMGLRNIKERLDEMGGNLKLSSTPGEGTTIEFTVNVPENSGTG